MSSAKPQPVALQFFLWGFMENTVFSQNPVSIDDLKIKISAAIDSIHVSTLNKVF